ncbi:unnamed protein product, partial [Prorocentrum cordatum]
SLSSLFSYDHCRPSPPPPLLPPVLIGAMGSRPAPPGGACQCSDRSRRCIGLAAAAAWIAAALCWSVVRFPSAADLLGRQAAAPAAEAAPPTAEALGSVAAAAAAEAADLGAGRLPPEARGSGGALPVAAGGAQPGRGPLPGGPPRPQGRTQQDARRPARAPRQRPTASPRSADPVSWRLEQNLDKERP